MYRMIRIFHPHSFDKLRTGSNLPPSRGKGHKDGMDLVDLLLGVGGLVV